LIEYIRDFKEDLFRGSISFSFDAARPRERGAAPSAITSYSAGGVHQRREACRCEHVRAKAETSLNNLLISITGRWLRFDPNKTSRKPGFGLENIRARAKQN